MIDEPIADVDRADAWIEEAITATEECDEPTAVSNALIAIFFLLRSKL